MKPVEHIRDMLPVIEFLVTAVEVQQILFTFEYD